MSNRQKMTQNLCIASVCLALCLVLPFLTGQDRTLGNVLCPMHIPVLLCGFLCGWPWGLAVGFIAPLLRCLIFQAPQLVTALAMAFELAAYGLLTGLFFRILPKKMPFLYVSLVIAMIGGRLVLGAVNYIMLFTGLPALLGVAEFKYSLEIFWANGFVTAIPGIVLQILIVPSIVYLLQKNNRLAQ